MSDVIKTDFLIIGSGIAGLSAAIEASIVGKVLVLSKEEPQESSTEYAQGGIAAAISDEDKVSFHFRDTLKAGDGLCNPDAVHIMVGEGPVAIQRLIDWGTEFDKDKTRLMFTREAAHSRKRVLHAGGDSTGREIQRALLAKVSKIENIRILPFHLATDFLKDEQGRIIGTEYLDEKGKKWGKIIASVAILASGGAARVYRETTNPEVATGDGMAMSARAGAIMQDMEFVQFHPTVLHAPDAPRFLLTEAIRGEGGVLRNVNGERFMNRYADAGELAPRDIVSRSIIKEMEITGSRTVFLDLSRLNGKMVRERFPKIYNNCLTYNLDLRKDLIPVAPAAHYFMGGVNTDIDGRTSLEGLFAAGEVACTGVHGANRLASNSLLEGLVFGIRAGRAAVDYFLTHAPSVPREFRSSAKVSDVAEPGVIARIRSEIQEMMWKNVGIVRNAEKLEEAVGFLRENYSSDNNHGGSKGKVEVLNMLTVSMLTAYAALMREESRGGHYRTDFPNKLEERRHSRFTLNQIF